MIYFYNKFMLHKFICFGDTYLNFNSPSFQVNLHFFYYFILYDFIQHKSEEEKKRRCSFIFLFFNHVCKIEKAKTYFSNVFQEIT